jgi:hypothetical protein
VNIFQNGFDWFDPFIDSVLQQERVNSALDAMAGPEAGAADADQPPPAEEHFDPFEWAAGVIDEAVSALAGDLPAEADAGDPAQQPTGDAGAEVDLAREMIDSDMRAKLMQDILQGSPNPPGFKPF